jgi:hypothetical protein
MISKNGDAKMAMLRVSDELHERFKKYIANRLTELDEIVTVNEAIEHLCGLGEKRAVLTGGSVIKRVGTAHSPMRQLPRFNRVVAVGYRVVVFVSTRLVGSRHIL